MFKEGMAERGGFEPTLPFRVNTLSKRAPSATRPSLRVLVKEGGPRNQGCSILPHRMRRARAGPPLLSRTPEEQDVPILILQFEPSQPVAIVFKRGRNRHGAGLEFSRQRVRVGDVEVRVPSRLPLPLAIRQW